MQGNAGRSLTVRRERYYCVKGWLYRLSALGEESDPPEVERFLESFRLLVEGEP